MQLNMASRGDGGRLIFFMRRESSLPSVLKLACRDQRANSAEKPGFEAKHGRVVVPQVLLFAVKAPGIFGVMAPVGSA